MPREQPARLIQRWILLVIASASIPQDDARAKEDPEVARITKGIWVIARRDAEAHPERLRSFSYDKRRMKSKYKSVELCLGFQDGGMMGLRKGEPLELALISATHAEGLGIRLRKLEKEPFWKKPLDDYRAAIDRLIRLVCTKAKAKEIRSAKDKLVTEVFFLNRAFEYHFKALDASVRGSVLRGTTANTGSLVTTIMLEPAGGSVRVLPRIRYEKLVLLKVPEAKMPWTVAKSSTLAVHYSLEFRVTWSGGKESRGTIKPGQTTTIRPQGQIPKR